MTNPANRGVIARRIAALLTLRHFDPAAFTAGLAARRAHRGRLWLDRHAVSGWHRNLFEPTPQGAHFRARDAYDNECVLALAFEFNKEMQRPASGRTTWGSVLEHFRHELRGRRSGILGFDTQTAKFARRHPEVHIGSKQLDDAWDAGLRSYYDFSSSRILSAAAA